MIDRLGSFNDHNLRGYCLINLQHKIAIYYQGTTWLCSTTNYLTGVKLLGVVLVVVTLNVVKVCALDISSVCSYLTF